MGIIENILGKKVDVDYEKWVKKAHPKSKNNREIDDETIPNLNLDYPEVEGWKQEIFYK